MVIRRGQVWWADLGEPVGSAPGYRRPVVVIQADPYNNSRLNTVIVAILTTNVHLADEPGNVMVPAGKTGLAKPSVINVTQLVTVDRRQMLEHIGQLSDSLTQDVGKGLRLVLAL